MGYHHKDFKGRDDPNHWRYIALMVSVSSLVFITMVWLGIAQYRGFNMRYFDLGVMSQAIWSVSKGQPLVFSGHGFPLSRLARNVELFYFLLAPLYSFFSSPETLIIFQAAVYVSGAYPLYILARRRLGNGKYAFIIALIYLLYPAAQTAVLFEFHGDALAMPLLIFAIEAMDRKAWRSYYLWLILALSCKWYIGIVAIALGLVLYARGDRKMGLVTGGIGTGWVIVSFLLIRPIFAPGDIEAVESRVTFDTYILSRFNIEYLKSTIILRLVNAVIILMPALIVLGWRAPLWLIPAAIITLPALMSSGFGPSFSYRTHHYAVAVPFLMAAIVYGAAKLRQKQENIMDEHIRKNYEWRGRVVLTLIITLIFSIAFVDTPLSPRFYLSSPGSGEGLTTTRYGVTKRDEMKENWITENVPADVAIASDDLIATRLVNRRTLYLTNRPFTRTVNELLDQVDYVVVDTLYDIAVANPEMPELTFGGGILHERQTIGLLLENTGFTLIQAQDGLLLFGRKKSGLAQSVELIEGVNNIQTIAVNQYIGLDDVEINQTDDRRFRIRYDWLPLEPLAKGNPMIAVTELAGVDLARMVHLPTWGVLPVEDWPMEQIVRETIEYELPSDIQAGTYRLKVGWYNARSIYAPDTDERSRVGRIVDIGQISVK